MGAWARRVLGVTAALIAACAEDGPEEIDARGYFHVAFESQTFRRCGEAKVMWAAISGNEPNATVLWNALAPIGPCEPLQRERGQCITEAFADLRARLSERGSWGHLGQYDRQIEILEVRSASAERPPGCEWREPVFRPRAR